MGKGLVALLYVSSRCLVTVSGLWLFLTVPWVGLQCVILVFSDHTSLLFLTNINNTSVRLLFVLLALPLILCRNNVVPTPLRRIDIGTTSF